MAERARVTSVDALKIFRTRLILYQSKARPAVEEVSADIQRARTWLQCEQRVKWEAEFRRRSRKLVDAQQALFGVRLSGMNDAPTSEQMAVRKAKKAVEEAEEKLRMIKLWDRQFDNLLAPLERQLAKLQTVLSNEVPKAVAYLGEAAKTLDAYTDLKAPSVAEPGGVANTAPGSRANASASWRACVMSAAGHRLSAVTKELTAQWAEAKEDWHDRKSQDFEKEFIQELLSSVDNAAPVIQQVDKLIEKIRKDCE